MSARGQRVAGALLLALFAIWAGLRLYSSHAPARSTAAGADGAAARSGAPGVRVPAGEASPPTSSDPEPGTEQSLPTKIPDRLPSFSLADLAGNQTAISTWRGKSLILNFWATWCPPCRREIPVLQRVAGQWGARGVQVVGIAVDHPDKVLAYADQMKITYPLLVGDQDALDVAEALGVDSPVFPFTVFTDRRGRVVTLYVGELGSAQANLILSAVQNLNLDRLQLAQARRTIIQGLRALPPEPSSSDP